MSQSTSNRVEPLKPFWRDLWAYFGPALIVSVAYMDPGNYGTDISGGASFRLEPLVLLVYSQVALSLLLPLPLIPLLVLTRDKLMGMFVNRRLTTIIATAFVVFILALNAVLLYLSFGGTI